MQLFHHKSVVFEYFKTFPHVVQTQFSAKYIEELWCMLFDDDIVLINC